MNLCSFWNVLGIFMPCDSGGYTDCREVMDARISTASFTVVTSAIREESFRSGLQALGSSPNIGKQLQESMDAQIRALTKGDITKEREILSLDTWRALTELNAQAKEYKQINAQINAKK